MCAILVCAACGRSPGPGKTPKETIRNFETALRDADLGACYDMMSARVRAQVDQAMLQVRAMLAGVPDSVLDQAGLGGFKEMSPREMLEAAVDKAQEMNPGILDRLEGIQLVVTDLRIFGERATADVTTFFEGREQSETVPLVMEGGRWYLDSDRTLNDLPFDVTPNIQASFAPS